MPHTFEPLPPDHPIFSIGVGFVFRSELPEPEEQHADDGEEHDVDERTS